MRKLIIKKQDDGKKLNNILLKEFNGLNINTIYKALRKKDIRVNNKKISENITLFSGDVLEIYIDDKYLLKEKNIILDIIYEDDNILIINKPIKIESVGKNSLEEILIKKYKNIYPCHRLDRNTSGLIIFAKNKETQDILLNKFKEKEIEKYYIAKVYGILDKKKDLLKAYLFKDAKKNMVYIKDKKELGYQEIITEYKVLKENKK